MVKEKLGPLTATEARAFHDVVGALGMSDGKPFPYLAPFMLDPKTCTTVLCYSCFGLLHLHK